jgi:hypothetical protein
MAGTLEPELQKMWNDAEKEFKARVEKSFDAKTLRRTGMPMSMEDVLLRDGGQKSRGRLRWCKNQEIGPRRLV